jgi:hypothetical protein
VLDRLRTLAAATVISASRTAESLTPDAAADRIVEALTQWGYGSADDSSTP